MEQRKTLLTLALLGSSFGVHALSAQSALITTSNDTFIRDGRSYTVNGTTDNLDFRYDFTAYFQFDMSSLGIGEILDATLTLHKITGPDGRNDTMVAGRVETYGLLDLVGNTEQNWDETAGGWQARVPDEDHGLDFRNVGNDWAGGTGAVASNLSNLDSASANVTETINGNVFQLSGTDLLTFLNARADANGFVTFLVENPESGGRGWGWATKEHADSSLHPTLSLSFTSDLAVIPEPSAMVALLGCLGLFAAAGRRRR
ncbi:MAG: hypothetical protein ACLFR7_03325 [Opitutales bacterium]